MINELYTLSRALAEANIEPYQWHQRYKPIPNIRANAPCICITLSEIWLQSGQLPMHESCRAVSNYG